MATKIQAAIVIALFSLAGLYAADLFLLNRYVVLTNYKEPRLFDRLTHRVYRYPPGWWCEEPFDSNSFFKRNAEKEIVGVDLRYDICAWHEVVQGNFYNAVD